MLGSFVRLRAVDPGFAGEELVFFQVDLAAAGYDDEQRAGLGPRLTLACST